MWASALLPLAVPIALIGLVLGLVSRRWLLLPVAMAAFVAAFGVAVSRAIRPDRTERHPTALRTLVGFLHVAQPFVRTWGRIRGQPLERAASHPAWSGDRWDWLRHLESDLRARRCALRAGGPSDTWDLEVVIGPFVAARVTTAVMWHWEPRHAVHYRPRGLLVLASVASLGWALVSPLGWLALALVSVVAVVEMVGLHLIVERALTHTTRGADAATDAADA